MSAVVVRFPKFPAEVLLPRFPVLDRDSGSGSAEGFPESPVLEQVLAFPEQDQAPGSAAAEAFPGSPALVREGLRVDGGLLLTAYTAEQEAAERYVVKTVRVNNRLQETRRVDLPVWGDKTFYCAPWADGTEGLWIYHAGQVQFYSTERDVLTYLTGLMKWRPVCDAALSVGEGAPLIVGLYIVATICSLGTVRSPHSRQYGRGKRKV